MVTATDADSDTLTYSLEGTDAASFDIESGTGQIQTKSGVTYDFEATQNTYAVTVKADDGNGGTDTIAVTISLTDADEKSDKPDKPGLARVTGSSTSLTATWEKPGLNGGPDITGYDLQYRAAPAGTWMDFAHTGTAVTATVTGLTADTSYQVQVRAKNDETPSDWSDPSDAVSTNAAGATCTDNDIDLTHGAGSGNAWEGDVLICHNDQQRAVCDDGLKASSVITANGWAFAGVVCRQPRPCHRDPDDRVAVQLAFPRRFLAGRRGVHRHGGQSGRLHAPRLGNGGLSGLGGRGRAVHGGGNGAGGDGRRRGGRSRLGRAGRRSRDHPPRVPPQDDRRRLSGGVDGGPGQRGGRGERGQLQGDQPGGGDAVRLRAPDRRRLERKRRGRGDREDDRGGRADELRGDARRRAGRAVVGRAGDRFGRDETPVPPEDDGGTTATGWIS